LLRRALLLLRPGELQELHELRTFPHGTRGTCDFIVSMLEQEEAGAPHSGGFRRKRDAADAAPRDDGPVSKALASLRVVKGKDAALPVALIQQCAATLTELDWFQMGYDATDSVLPRCARLESLTLYDWIDCPPAAWLRLSQLHTLRGVSLSKVSAAAIAAALPRLHTLHLNNGHGEFSVAAFYDELLPRLRSFGLHSTWPKMSEGTEVADGVADMPPLPLLDDLKWAGWDPHLPRQLMGARPSTLNISDVDLVMWLKAADGASAESPTATSPLARVQALTLRLGRTPPEAACMAQVLREAPQLRQLTFYVQARDHARWVLSEEFTSEPAFAGLVHPKLRHVAVTSMYREGGGPVPDVCGMRLRQRHFPRLRRLTMDDEEHPV
jgi:hypothetical protein